MTQAAMGYAFKLREPGADIPDVGDAVVLRIPDTLKSH